MKTELDIRVASIIDSERLVINKGSKDLISNGMEFLVFSEGPEIMDPITGTSLGNLEKPKGFFKVSHIQDNMTVLITKLYRPNKFFAISVLDDLSPEIELLKTIKVGDRVKITNQTEIQDLKIKGL